MAHDIRKDDDTRWTSQYFPRKNKGIDGAWDTRKDDVNSIGSMQRRYPTPKPPSPKPHIKLTTAFKGGEITPAVPPALTGGKSKHYQVQMEVHCAGSLKDTVIVEFDCNDLIEELNMTFAEGEVFKAVWRKSAARLGNGKPGHQPLYDAQKIEFFGKRMVTIHSKKA